MNDFLVAYETAALSFEKGSGPKIELPFNSPPQVRGALSITLIIFAKSARAHSSDAEKQELNT